MSKQFYSKIVRQQLLRIQSQITEALETLDTLDYLDTSGERPYDYYNFHEKLTIVDKLYEYSLKLHLKDSENV